MFYLDIPNQIFILFCFEQDGPSASIILLKNIINKILHFYSYSTPILLMNYEY